MEHTNISCRNFENIIGLFFVRSLRIYSAVLAKTKSQSKINLYYKSRQSKRQLKIPKISLTTAQHGKDARKAMNNLGRRKSSSLHQERRNKLYKWSRSLASFYTFLSWPLTLAAVYSLCSVTRPISHFPVTQVDEWKKWGNFKVNYDKGERSDSIPYR